MTGQSIILAVDRNRRNLDLLAHVLDQHGYQVRSASTLEELDLELEHLVTFALALIGLAGFDHRIWPRCDQLRSAHIPFLLIVPKSVRAVHQISLAHGARGTLVKPLKTRELVGTIHRLIQE